MSVTNLRESLDFSNFKPTLKIWNMRSSMSSASTSIFDSLSTKIAGTSLRGGQVKYPGLTMLHTIGVLVSINIGWTWSVSLRA